MTSAKKIKIKGLKTWSKVDLKFYLNWSLNLKF